MNNLIEFASLFLDSWRKKTLEDLRVEAEREDSGIKFESVRSDAGQRFIVVLCITDIDQIVGIEKRLNLVDDGIVEDWNTLTLVAVVMRTAHGDGFAFESIRDEYARRSALVLIATDPRSMCIVESVFKFPK